MTEIYKLFSADCPQGPFILFSTPHILAIGVIAGACILLYTLRNRFKSKETNRQFRIVLALVLILQEVSFHLWNIGIGEWSIKYTLPLQLCSISTILSAVMLLSKSYPLYEIVYFWGIGGAMQAILTPEIGIYTYPHYRYFQFFLAHGTIIAACLFMTFVQRYRPKLKSIGRALVFLNVYAVFIGIFNKAAGANYLFICGKPEVSSIMDLLGPWPWYILSLEIVASAIFCLLYLPFAINDYINTGSTRNKHMDF